MEDERFHKVTRISKCILCTWRAPGNFGPQLPSTHILLKHPREFYEATGLDAESRLARYKQELAMPDVLWEMFIRLATAEDPIAVLLDMDVLINWNEGDWV